jgi:quinol monooxygenase YgiN
VIIRIVQMTFRQEGVSAFQKLFSERMEQIRYFPGCQHLELWQDANNQNSFFTYSIWNDEESLNHYRFSELFKDTWGQTKALFDKKAQAYSLLQKAAL